MSEHEAKRMMPSDNSMGFVVLLSAFELFCIIVYWTGTDYDPVQSGAGAEAGDVSLRYAFYQDVNAMIYLGFGFLMTFLARYGWGAVGFTFLLSAATVQFAILITNFTHQLVDEGKLHVIDLSVESLIGGDFAAGAVMISFGALIGRASPTQLFVMMLFEIIFYSINEAIGVIVFEAVDMGGSMYVHTFGAYFGLAVSWMLGTADAAQASCSRKDAPATSKVSGTFAMIGTLILWMFWPSFNGALAQGSQQHRVVINTVLSIAGSCISAFLLSRLLRGGKFSMEDVQNATLAGGVAIGSSSDLIIHPGPATLVGVIAGLISVGGYVYVSPILSGVLGVDDTCGVNNLHGMPGILGGVVGAISASLAGETEYGQSIGEVFAARAGEDGRSASEQGGFQASALLLSLALSITGGVITGFVIRQDWFGPVAGPAAAEDGTRFEGAGQWEDERFWDTSELGEAAPGDKPYGGVRHRAAAAATGKESLQAGQDKEGIDTA